jgi:magnesium chelatase family protein
MATQVKCFAIQGIEAFKVDIEIKIMDGMPQVSVIGLGDQAVREAAERIESAIDECGYVFPKKRVIISLAPSDLKKTGSHFDLAMAIGVLQEAECIAVKDIAAYGFVGELALDGRIRACRGILPMVIAAKQNGYNKIIVPAENIKEASLVHGIESLGFDYITDVVRYLEGKIGYEPKNVGADASESGTMVDFADVVGQDELIEAITLAAAGGHNMLMIGEPGCGKTMVAQRIPTILPIMTEAECLEVTKIYSIAGMLPSGHSLMQERPFRAPHHNASLNALIGGGSNAMPGEVSLAHNGVLFLDELAEFSKRTLDALRQPVEDKKVSISRVNATHTFPANFMFITAMNPCPCGYWPGKKCRCTDYEVIKYRGRISGPIMDRIDIQKNVHPVDYFAKSAQGTSKSSETLRNMVEKAREIQQKRFENDESVFNNSQMNTTMLKKYCELDSKSLEVLKDSSEKYGYSARTIHKLLRLARTSADLDGAENIRIEDVRKVLNLRELDRSNSEMLIVGNATKEKETSEN